jgi:hypothetical protein
MDGRILRMRIKDPFHPVIHANLFFRPSVPE